ncbi:carbohydrate-binding module family 50 protein [Pleomassaria siparia CBS 279.74]|uniref:Carbohydrate-binding module family 50 protein n=1 Tax=Pleomassaria siparia CBS 279.74 TaxID=1314801 RepID=A0A6G1K7I0_9PLEO|nr:carbohydrate-binding module family 50 protein [Pleomassaria siparia CBS 279.74]
MGRWTDQDSDEQRLPHGMERVGYDADTQTYTYRDASGAHYEGGEGNRYGELHPGKLSHPSSGRRLTPDPTEVAASNAQIEKSNREAVRHMLPFALLVLSMLLLLFHFLNGGFSGGGVGKKPAADDAREQIHCGEGLDKVQIKEGDTCWEFSRKFGLSVDELIGLKGNEAVNCDNLRLGNWICVPTGIVL